MVGEPRIQVRGASPGARSLRLLTRSASLALLFGATLFILRAGAVLAGEGLGEGGDRALALWHVGLGLERAFPFALVIGAAATTVALTLSRRAIAAVALCGALFLVSLSGWLVDDPFYVPDLGAARGRMRLLELSVVALALSSLMLWACRRALRPTSRGFLSSPAALHGCALFAVLVAATGWALFRRTPPVRTVHETARVMLLGPPSWSVVSSQAGHPPYVGLLTPTLDWNADGGDLPSLIMPPPCEVRFEIRPEDGPVRLRAAAGCDRRLRWQLESAPQDGAVVFEIAVNGERRFDARIPAHGSASSRTWHHAGGREGIALSPGDVVTLRTSLSPSDVPVVGELGLLAGFGRCELERAVERPRERADRERPNILLVVMDTLRADELSCYGHPGRTTPELDRLAARGVLYERACATSSWTWPSTASILTGLPPEAHGVVDDGACYLDGSLDTLAEVLGRRNYTTGAFACNPLLDPGKNFDQGFETFDYSRDFRKTDQVLPDIDAWMGRHADSRFFLYLHFVDTHEPHRPRPEDLERVGTSALPPPGCPERPMVDYRAPLMKGMGLTPEGKLNADLVIPPEHQRWIRDIYSASVSTADHYVGEVLRMLEAHDLEEKTLVAFTSDHGEELFDHGFLGHSQTVCQELIHVPLILAGPGIHPGVRVDAPVSNRSLFWTLAHRGGVEMREVLEPVDLASSGSLQPRAVFFSTEHGWWWNNPRLPIAGIQDWPWVLHYVPRGLPWGAAADADPGEGQVRLYNLEEDPGERVDLAGARPDLAQALRRRIVEHGRTAAGMRPRVAPGAGDATLEMLRRMGYSGDDR
jgi:arylsulfatase A-like enzyme